MIEKIEEQAPTLLLTAVLIVVSALWLRHENNVAQQALVEPLMTENEALKAAADDNRREIAATSQLLRAAVSQREVEAFRPDVELQKLDTQRMNALADAIAKKVLPTPVSTRSADEVRQAEEAQVERIASRTADKMRPMLSNLAADDGLATDETMKKQFERNQQLSTDLLATQAAAQDALKLSQQLGALYLGSFKDQGMLPRVLTLPGNLVHDVVTLSVFSDRDQKNAQVDVSSKIDAIERRIDEIQAEAMKVKS